jgi:peptide/nickel transport system substrate-binding protein
MTYQVIMDAGLRTTGVPTFQILQRDFAKIGVQLSLRTYEGAATFEAIAGLGNRYDAFDLAPYDPDFMLAIFTCAQYGNFNDSGYCNSAYDAMYVQQGAAIDPAKRRAIVYRMQEMLARDRPYIVLDYPEVLDAYREGWTGFYDMPGAGTFGTFGKQSLIDVHRTS